MVYHDDWLINVLLSDGRVYTFSTEYWEEWLGCQPNDWTTITYRAENKALQYAGRNEHTWGLDAIPDTIEQFKTAMNRVSRFTSDRDFRKFIKI